INLVLRSMFVTCILLSCESLLAQTKSPAVVSPSAAAHSSLSNPGSEKKLGALLQKMTLEEKVGQLVQYSAGQPTGPGTGRTDYDDMIRKGEVGALFNIATARQVNAYQRVAVEQSRLHIPILFGLDVIHGFRTEFPVPLGLAASWDPDLIEQTARVAARETSASGIRWAFSPMVDIARDARWGRMTEGSGEDPFLGAAIARAYVRGYQGPHLDAPDSIAACPKHFVGYGAAEGGRDYNSVEISEHTLRQLYLPPFHAAIESGAATLMSAFNSLNAVPSTANPFTLKQILKGEWGFQGIVDSDYTSVAELIAHAIGNDGATAARKAFLAGVDMDMVSSLYHENLVQLVRSGRVPEAAVNESVRRVLRVKFALGLFEHPYTEDTQEAEAVKAAEQSDIAILALGENAPEMTGEAAARAFLGLPGRQEELLEKVVATGKPVVLLIFSGRPLTLPWAFEHVPAVMAAWFPGMQAGPALVRTLFGEATPSGRLVVSWPRSAGQEPLYYNALDRKSV